MDREQHEEWFEFEQRARTEILKEEEIEFRRGVSIERLFQIIKFSSFFSSISWEIFSERTTESLLVKPDFNDGKCNDQKQRAVANSKESKFFAVRKEWPRVEDSKKFETPLKRLAQPKNLDPTIKSQRLEITNSLTDQMIRKLKLAAIPILVQRTNVGFDGTSWHFVSGDKWAGISLTWWEDLPSPSKPVSDLIKDVFGQLEKLAQP